MYGLMPDSALATGTYCGGALFCGLSDVMVNAAKRIYPKALLFAQIRTHFALGLHRFAHHRSNVVRMLRLVF